MTLSNTMKHKNFDAVVVGAGFSGLYMLYRLREAGYSTCVFEAGDGVGGVWYWNRYPGARCDIDSIYYNYSFSKELYNEWTWSSRYAEQPEILQYLNFVADKFDLRKDIQFNTWVDSAHYDEKHNRWKIHTVNGDQVTAKYLITGVGCLSASNIPNFKGLESFEGDYYHTGQWPHEEVDFSGKRVGVIGTGSSGVQSIPKIAERAEHLTVFQRTPQYSIPARNYPYDPEFVGEIKMKYEEIKKQMRSSYNGIPMVRSTRSALEDTEEVRNQVYEDAWQKGGFFTLANTYNDLMKDPASNDTLAEFVRGKIRSRIDDPELAKKLVPTYYYGTKRAIIDTDYYETYRRDNVSLVDVKKTPIEEIFSTGLRTTKADYKLDVLVFATGYDAMTGPLLKIDIRGKEGKSLKEKWNEGVRTYLGITTAGFPNMFMITGPESPSVLTNMPVSIEQHVEWISDCIEYLNEHNIETIEADVEAEENWSRHCRELSENTLFNETKSWYTGANIEGKPNGFLIYLGGADKYREICDKVAAQGYEGFSLMLKKTAIHR